MNYNKRVLKLNNPFGQFKPFEIKQSWVKAIKKSKFGVLMTDNDYKDGILRVSHIKFMKKQIRMFRL